MVFQHFLSYFRFFLKIGKRILFRLIKTIILFGLKGYKVLGNFGCSVISLFLINFLINNFPNILNFYKLKNIK